MKPSLLLTGLLALLPYYGYTQTTAKCKCATTISQSGTYDNKTLKIQPGQTVCIRVGSYTGLSFKNFVGTAAQPIRFVNCGGQVNAGAETSAGALTFDDCSFFALSGSGDSAVRYGFVTNKCRSGVSTVSVGGLSSNYELERVEVTGSGYAGFFLKLEPGCDSLSCRPNYTVRSVKIHDNYIHDTPGTAMFLGSSQSPINGVLVTCNGVKKRVYPVQTEGLEVYNNRIEYIGGAALTINNAPGASMHDNSILYTNLGSVPPGWQVGGSSVCGCDYTVSQSGTFNNYLLRVPPGKTVCLKAGVYNNLNFNNFIGTPTQPIHFINCGGLVTSGSPANYACLEFGGSRYFSLSGSGDPRYEYGIKLASSTTGAALSVGALSSDCAVHHVEVAESGFAGIVLKTDPSCDSTTWRSNFTMYNVDVHDNYIHDTKGEGIYAGNSFFGNGMILSCSGIQKTVYPHLIYGLHLHHNRIERTGAEGLQYACAPDAQVHHNTLLTLGISPFASYQNNGLQIGGGAGGDCYSNIIRQAAGMGIIIVGHWGNNRIFNNVISQAGGDGIFCDDRVGSLPGTYMQIVNNTISGTGRDGIRMYNQDNINTIANNAITNWGSTGKPIVFQQGATATMTTNLTAVSYQAMGYRDAANGDFSVLATSMLIDVGTHAAVWGVAVDRLDQPRPSGSAYDVGAYEYVADSNNSPINRVEPLIDLELDATGAFTYPSPCYNQLTLRLRSGSLIDRVDVYSTQGQLISQTILSEGQAAVVLPTSTWSTGIYTYQIQAGGQVIRGHVVKL